MSKDKVQIVKTMKQTTDVVPASADVHALKSEEQQYSVHRYCGDIGYLVRVQVSIGLSLHHMGSLIHGSVESQISAIVTVCWWVDQD